MNAQNCARWLTLQDWGIYVMAISNSFWYGSKDPVAFDYQYGYPLRRITRDNSSTCSQRIGCSLMQKWTKLGHLQLNLKISDRLSSKAKHRFSSVRNRTNPKCFQARLVLSEIKFAGWTSMTMITLRSLPIKVGYSWRRCFVKKKQGDSYLNFRRKLSFSEIIDVAGAPIIVEVLNNDENN